MQSQSTPDFEIAEFKTVMEQAPTKDNGWSLAYEGEIHKDFKGILLL